MSAFDPAFDDLPERIPIFPLSGVLLLPRGELPLNIFEPRYLNMTADALSADRMIGMIQPTEHESNQENPPVYSTGCAGRIISFQEADDGRFLIRLKGICRFNAAEELDLCRGYRPVRPDWSPFRGDLAAEPDGTIDREQLFASLRGYFAQQSIDADWKAIESTPDERLVTSLSMICPFEPSEKQALLEAPTLGERGRVLNTLVAMSLHGGDCRAARQ